MLGRFVGKAAIAIAVFLSLASAAIAQSRIALVIGNSAYQTAPQLKTTVADAGLVAETLRGAGYDVTELRDLRQANIGQTMRDFLDKAAAAGPEGVAFLYFAGYAAQSDGDNYLIPVDAVINRDVEVADEAFSLDDLIDELAKLQLAGRVVILDASRDHRFGSAGNQPVPKGLAMADTVPGMLIGFAAAPGAVTAEEDGPYSLYTATLVTLMRQPGLDMEQILKATRLQVNKATAGEQTPWMTGDLAIDLTLFAATPDAPAAQAMAGLRIPPKGDRVVTKDMLRGMPPDEAYLIAVEEDTLEAYQWFVELFPRHRDAAAVWEIIETRREAVLWRRSLAQNTTRAYWNYLKRYPNGAHAMEAQDRLAALSAPRMPPAAYTPVPEPLPPNYYDEAVGLVEIVPEGFEAPVSVFEALIPLFIQRGPRDFDRRRRDRVTPNIPVVRGDPVRSFTQRDGRNRDRTGTRDTGKKTGIVRGTDRGTTVRGTDRGTTVRGTDRGTTVRGTDRTTTTKKTGVGLPPSGSTRTTTTPSGVRDGVRGTTAPAAGTGTGTGVRGTGSRTGVGLPPATGSQTTPPTGVRPTTPGTPTTTPPTGVRSTSPTTTPQTGTRPGTPTVPAVPPTGVRPTTPGTPTTTPPTGVRPTLPTTTPQTGTRPGTPTVPAVPPTGVRPTTPGTPTTTPPTGVRPTSPTTTPQTGTRPTTPAVPAVPQTGVRPTPGTPATTPPTSVRPTTTPPSTQRPALPPTSRPTTPAPQSPTSTQRPGLPTRPAPQVQPAPQRPAPQVRPAPQRPAPQVRPAPQRPAPQVRPAPQRPAPQVRPAPQRPAPAARPAAPPPRPAAPPPRPAPRACPPGKRC